MSNVVEVRIIDHQNNVVHRCIGIKLSGEWWKLSSIKVGDIEIDEVKQWKEKILVGKEIVSFYDNLETGITYKKPEQEDGIYYMRDRRNIVEVEVGTGIGNDIDPDLIINTSKRYGSPNLSELKTYINCI